MKRLARTLPFAFALSAVLSPAVLAQDATPVASPVASASIGSLNFLGEVDLSNLTMVDGTLVGGLSGIDFDPATGQWVVISDDRSQNNPARFYDANITYNLAGFESVDITAANTFLQEDGSPYPNAEIGGEVPDPEGIRFDPNTGGIIWTSEGDRALGINPVINMADATGQTTSTITLDDRYDMHPNDEQGTRNNAALEGLTLSVDGQSIWTAMEGPLYQDGADATADAGSVTRITQHNLDGTVAAEYAYPLDPIAAKPEGDGGNNGVTEILAVSDTQFLMIERSGVPDANNVWKMYIRIYLVDITGATDISDLDALQGADYTEVTKTLLLDLSETDLPFVDNIEGVTWGPTLENGNRSLVFVSDNNFNATQITQFLAYEVLP